MTAIDPQQEIFIALRAAVSTVAEEMGCGLYDTVLPPEDTPYPFVYFGYTQQIDSRNKSQINGTVFQTVDVWHNDVKKRGDVSAIMLAVKQACFKVRRTKAYVVEVTLDDQEIRPDTSLQTALIRGIMNFRIYFT